MGESRVPEHESDVKKMSERQTDRKEGEIELVKDPRVKGGRDAEGELASVGQRQGLERKREGDVGGRRGKIERLRSTFLCKLTGLDAQLTGLFWQVSDGPYYYFTAGPLGPCISGHNRTGQAGKKRKKSGMAGEEKTLHLTSSLRSSLALHSPTAWASAAC